MAIDCGSLARRSAVLWCLDTWFDGAAWRGCGAVGGGTKLEPALWPALVAGEGGGLLAGVVEASA